MGNCRSTPAAAAAAAAAGSSSAPSKPSTTATQPSQPQSTTITQDHSTSALVQALLPVLLPMIQKVISHQLVQDQMVLYQEELVTEFHPDSTNGEKEWSLGPLQLLLENVQVVDGDTLEGDMAAMPKFDWPESKRSRQLMQEHTPLPRTNASNSNSNSNSATAAIAASPTSSSTNNPRMIVLDLLGVHLHAQLSPGMELAVPVEGPFGMTAILEVGTGGSILQASLELYVPQLRLWFVTDTRQLHVAFMARPRIVPHVHINVDRGRGDFLDLQFTDGGGGGGGCGGLDDTIESILCGFGPTARTQHHNVKSKSTSSSSAAVTTKEAEAEAEAEAEPRSCWVADALGRRISDALEVVAGVRNNPPLESDLYETIQASLDSAMGKPRPVEEIEADLQILQDELKRAKEQQHAEVAVSQQESISEPKTKTNQVRHHDRSPTEEKKDSDGTNLPGTAIQNYKTEKEDGAGEMAPSFLCCGLGV